MKLIFAFLFAAAHFYKAFTFVKKCILFKNKKAAPWNGTAF